MGPPSSTRRRAAFLLCAAAASVVGGCNFVGTNVHNLEALHDEAGRHQRRGAIMSDLEYAFRVGLVKGVPGLTTRDAHVEDIDDPLGLCVRNMAELAEYESEDPRVIALQVQLLARFAVDDPWNLSREEAVTALGRIGAQLGVSMFAAREGEPATVEEVRDAIARLLSAARSTLDFGEEELDTSLPEEDLSAACVHIDGMVLDREGALRLLRAGTLIEARTGKRDQRVKPLRRTLVQLERVCVVDTLRAALHDRPADPTGGSYAGWESPRVRAAAIGACVEAFGPHALADFLSQLRLDPTDEVIIAILEQVRRRGLPDLPAELGPEEAAGRREQWIEAVLAQATDNANGTVRVAAMRALETISDGALRSLREEDWLAWHQAR